MGPAALLSSLVFVAGDAAAVCVGTGVLDSVGAATDDFDEGSGANVTGVGVGADTGCVATAGLDSAGAAAGDVDMAGEAGPSIAAAALGCAEAKADNAC